MQGFENLPSDGIFGIGQGSSTFFCFAHVSFLSASLAGPTFFPSTEAMHKSSQQLP